MKKLLLSATTLALCLATQPASAQFPGRPGPDPLGTTPQQLLQRDFEYMRSTLPSWARRPATPGQPPPPGRPPGGGYVGGGYGGGGYVGGGFGNGGYGGYQPGYGFYGGIQVLYGYYGGYYGYWHPSGIFVALAPQSLVQQREVIIYREGSGNGGQQPPTDSGRGGGTRPPAGGAGGTGGTDQGDGFYLGKRGPKVEEEVLSDALDDIRKAWLNGDFDRLKARFKTDGTVGIYPKGQFKYAVPTADFLGMVKDAMSRLDTISLEFDRPKSDANGKVFVSGKHAFYDTDSMDKKEKRETYISYGFERVDGKWKVVEAGSGSAPITKHQ